MRKKGADFWPYEPKGWVALSPEPQKIQQALKSLSLIAKHSKNEYIRKKAKEATHFLT